MDPQMTAADARKPTLLCRPIDQDFIEGKPGTQCGVKFEFTDHFDRASGLSPPREQRCERLGFAGQPVARGAPEIETFQLCEGDSNRLRRE